MDLQDTANGEGVSLAQTQQYEASVAEVLAAFEGARGVSATHGSAPFATGLGLPRSDDTTVRLRLPPVAGAVLQSLANLIPDFDDLRGGGALLAEMKVRSSIL
jgi:hypothetical protein